MPIRLDWDTPLVQTLHTPKLAQARSCSLGHDWTHTLTLRPETTQPALTDGQRLPSEWGTSHRPEQASRTLAGLVEDGQVARFEMMEWLAEKSRWYLGRAALALTYELGSPPGARYIDDIGLDTIADLLTYGRQGDETSAISRLVDRCLLPDTFQKVDPARYINLELRRQASEAVRRHVGDPKMGARIRQVARDLSTLDVERVVKACRTRFPHADVSYRRVEAALDYPRILPVAVPFPDENIDSFEIQRQGSAMVCPRKTLRLREP